MIKGFPDESNDHHLGLGKSTAISPWRCIDHKTRPSDEEPR